MTGQSDFKDPSRSISHTGSHGYVFEARADLKGGVHVKDPVVGSGCAGAMADYGEFIGFHALQVWPTLNGFAGYDCVEIKFE